LRPGGHSTPAMFRNTGPLDPIPPPPRKLCRSRIGDSARTLGRRPPPGRRRPPPGRRRPPPAALRPAAAALRPAAAPAGGLAPAAVLGRRALHQPAGAAASPTSYPFRDHNPGISPQKNNVSDSKSRWRVRRAVIVATYPLVRFPQTIPNQGSQRTERGKSRGDQQIWSRRVRHHRTRAANRRLASGALAGRGLAFRALPAGASRPAPLPAGGLACGASAGGGWRPALAGWGLTPGSGWCPVTAVTL
jgi:hypothetical protein